MANESPYWMPPEVWPNETCFIIGGGTSLKSWDKKDWARLRDKHVIGCNDAYTKGTWVDVCYFGDDKWIQYHKHLKRFQYFPGLKVAITPNPPRTEGVHWVCRRPKGLWKKMGRVGWNESTGVSAINLAILFGCTRIILLGFDMKLDENGNNNWHDNNVDPSIDETVFPRHIEGAEYVKDQLANFPGVKVFNATPCSAMKTFPIIMPEDVL